MWACRLSSNSFDQRGHLSDTNHSAIGRQCDESIRASYKQKFSEAIIEDEGLQSGSNEYRVANILQKSKHLRACGMPYETFTNIISDSTKDVPKSSTTPSFTQYLSLHAVEWRPSDFGSNKTVNSVCAGCDNLEHTVRIGANQDGTWMKLNGTLSKAKPASCMAKGPGASSVC